MGCPIPQDAVAGITEVDTNESLQRALAGAAQPPRAVDVLKLSHVMMCDYILSGVRQPHTPHSHAPPEKFDFVWPRYQYERRATLPTPLASLGKLGGHPRQGFRLDATSGLKGLMSVLRRDAAAGCSRFRFDEPEYRRRQAAAEQTYANACAYESVCLVSAVRTRICIRG